MGRAATLKFLVLIVSLLVTMCSIAHAKAESGKVSKVVLQLRWDHQFQFAGYYAAQWQGYYRDAGLDVEIRSAIAADGKILKAVDEVREKRAHFGIGGSDILLAHDRYGDFTVLACIFQQSAARIYALKSLQVNSPAGLAGKRVARNKGDLIDVEMQVMLNAEGIDQAKLVSVPHTPTIDALKRGKVDAMPGYSMSLPYEARLAGLELSSLNPSTYGVDFYGDSLFCLNSWAAANSGVVESFVSASLKGWEYALTHSEEIIQRISGDLPRAVPIADPLAFNHFQAQVLKQLTMYPVVQLGHINPGRWERMHHALRDAGVISGRLDFASFIYDAPQRAARKVDEKYKRLKTIGSVATIVVAVIVLWIVTLRRQIKSVTRSFKETQLSLMESEEKYRLIAKATSDYVYSATFYPDSTTFLDWASEKFLAITGYTVEEINNMPHGWLSIVNQNDIKEIVESKKSDDILHKGNLESKYRITTKNGEIRYLHDRIVTAEPFENGTIRGVGGVTDITELKSIETSLLSYAARLESLLRISQFEYTNVQELLDYALHEAIQLTESKIGYIYFYDEKAQLFTLNSWSKEVMNECRIIEKQKTYALTSTGLWGEAVRQRRPIVVNDFLAPNPLKKGYPEGHAPLHSFLTIPVFSKDSIVAVVGVANKDEEYTDADVRQLALMMEFVWNVTEQAKAELELQAFEKRNQYLAEIIERSLNEIYVFDADTFKFIYVNRVALDNLSYSAEQMYQMTPVDIKPEMTYESFRAALKPLMNGTLDIYNFQTIHRRANGSDYSVDVNLQLVEDQDRRVFLAITNDITDWKQLESQLLQSQKMEAVGQLAGGVAHDFNNILTVIAGYSALLQTDSSIGEKQREYLAEIGAAADKASQLTHGLLAFSRKQKLVMKHENLTEIIQHVHKFLARIIGEDITLNTSCSGSELPVFADYGQIEQVLINLATNARDAMPGGGSFTVRGEMVLLDESIYDYHKNSVPPGRYALLSVSDTGHGIRKEHLCHIFEPFFTTKEVGKGTGLGMAIIYGIIKQHNGFINVSSEPGHGTTFMIYLPLDESTIKPLTDTAKTTPKMGNNETILVAEDDPAVSRLVSKILVTNGYEVILAEDGADAIEKFRAYQDKIRLVMLDMIMPKKSGKEASEEINNIRPETKIIFSSGYTADFIENRGISDEGVELILKPVQPNDLLIKVREMLDR
ncbi:MAG: PAS domain S-box protein [Deltaproteobacteria bacterium]|nr:PAS domain S-box protein [Deltaproteobacteria bacterium]TLN03269.1 MAG: PAS domain S-box protein [bacterium]